MSERGTTMQQIGPSAESETAERKRVEAVVETLAGVRSRGETLAEVAHDARNMVTALGLYCDLLEEPGVLDTQFLHYGNELRLVAGASRRLVEKLMALDHSGATSGDSLNSSNGVLRGRGTLQAPANSGVRIANRLGLEQKPARPIESFAAELMANRNLLASFVGPSISLIVDAEGGALPVGMTGEDLTRVLVNLVKNAAESMAAGGRITLGLHEFHGGADAAPWLVLTVEDNGSGIPSAALEKIFEAGYTTRSKKHSDTEQWPGSHRGLGLSITRSILSSAGGNIRAANRDSGGGRFIIELPVRTQ
jgi:signal transduction histidine kinase